MRCTGHCCRQFTLPSAPSSIRRLAVASRDPELNQIANMVIYLGPSDHNPISGKEWPGLGHIYTCRNLDTKTGDCNIYEHRPAHMCASYPYGKACEAPDCTEPERGVHIVQIRRRVAELEDCVLEDPC